MFQKLQELEEQWTEKDQMEYLCAKVNELTMKRIDENATTCVIDVADEDERDDTSETEVKEVALSRKLASATMKESKKRGQKQAELPKQTKLTKFFKPNKN